MLRIVVATGAVFGALCGSALSDSDRPELAPLPFVKFCQTEPKDCEAHGDAVARMKLSPDVQATVTRVNEAVNGRIRPRLQADAPGLVPDWSIGPAEGDCNDFAVTKRHDLLAEGLPSSVLLLAAVEIPGGGGHLVVILKAEGGDRVLDNLTPDIRLLHDTGYRVLREQSGSDPRRWVKPG